LLGLEPLRAVIEYTRFRLMDRDALPAGDGHPVVIFPGLAANEVSIGPLKAMCEALGYAVYDWGRGFNLGPKGDVDDWLRELATHVQGIERVHERRVSLIGWSLGGIYAREIAKIAPAAVRSVITLGTPFGGTPEQTHVGWLYRLVSGHDAALDRALLARLRKAPPVPSTAIFSRTDGIVAWTACRNASRSPCCENIEVEASHVGLGWHPTVLAIVADRLRQPEGAWRPYRSAARRRPGTQVAAKPAWIGATSLR
jgi:pimeloyl-ACP methyl ester carboxylesterase